MSTAIVLVTDQGYLPRAERTLNDLRTRGDWHGHIVLIPVGFTPSSELIARYNLQIVQFPRIPIDGFLQAVRDRPFTIPTCDGRELTKTVQWEKLHAFDSWFWDKYERIIYIDAGSRIVNPIAPILDLDWRGKFICPDDSPQGERKYFKNQLELVNRPDELGAFDQAYPGALESAYFLNCIWIYDTSLRIEKQLFVDLIAKYPIWKTNEMCVMNVVLTFDKKIWTPMPMLDEKTQRILFDWTERGRASSDYIVLKYPRGLRN
jgi:hypothetical protein